jgi:hypothetical protein
LDIISQKEFNKKIRDLLQLGINDDCNPKRFISINRLNLYLLYSQSIKYFKSFNKSIDKDAFKCWDSIFNNMVDDYNYTNLYFYSGHKLPDIGDPVSCLNDNYTYLLALLTYDIYDNSTKIEDKISYFTSKTKSNLGICLWEECNNYISQNLINNIDQVFKNNIMKIYNIKDLKINWNHHKIKDEKNKLSVCMKLFISLLIIYMIAFIVLKILVKYSSIKKKVFEGKMRKREKKDYLKLEESNIIKEEENEDDVNEEEEEEKEELEEKDKIDAKKNKKKRPKSKSNVDENKSDEEEENEDEEDEYDEDNDDESKISNDSLFKKDIEQSKIRYIENNLNKMAKNKTAQVDFDDPGDESNSKKKSLINSVKKKNQLSNFIITLYNFNHSFLKLIRVKTLTGFKNKIYSNKGLEMITGLRTFCLVLITLNICFRLFVESPAMRQLNYTFIQDFLFGSIKFSSFGMYYWVYLDGLVYTFKLMHFVKNDKSFDNFVKFMINLLPKIFIFLFIFYGVYFLQRDIGIMEVSSMVFEQYVENEYNYKCLSNPLYLLFPFFNPVSYEKTKFVNNYFNNCYQFSYLIINEFYCILIFFAMFYYLYKYKSKKLDIIVSLGVLANILIMNFIPYFYEGVKDEKYYLLKYILGETFSLRYPHNMFNIFFIGVFSGLIYYYNSFSVNDINSFLAEDYLPFQYLYYLMQLLFKSNWIIKTFLILFNLGVIIIDCLIYYILQTQHKDQQILYEFTGLLKIFYLYETPIVIMCTSVLLIILLMAEDKYQIKMFLGSRIFYIMEKISFSYVCLIQILCLLFLSSSNNHGEIWTFIFFFNIMFFEFFLGIIVSFVFTFAFELPVKVVANILRGKEMNEKKLKEL